MLNAPVTLIPAKLLLTLAALFLVACSDDKQSDAPRCVAAGLVVSGAAGAGGLGGDTGGDALFVPQGINVTARPGINSVFNVIALTLRPGASGAEVYAAVRNDGQILACNASFSVELHDKDDQTLGAGISGLQARRFYRFTDGSGSIASCVAPGEVVMIAIQRLDLDAPIEDVKSVVYQSNYWGNLPLAAIEGVSLTGVQAVTRGTGVAYTGALVNGLDTALSGPTVAVFPLSAVGRPLDVAYGGSSVVLPRCGTWDFETSPISASGVAYDAYPMGGP
ncbi:MAG: hypothetical protein WDO74_25205 [Pseudomonadota bacterium]